MEKKQFGHGALYEQIHQDALMLIESYGFAISPKTAGKIFKAMPPDQAALVNYSEELGRIYIPQATIDACLDRIRQGIEFWPRGFGTGGMAAYIVDDKGPRSPVPEDMQRLAELFGRTDILTSLQSSFNICNSIRKKDTAARIQAECKGIDDMIERADGKTHHAHPFVG